MTSKIKWYVKKYDCIYEKYFRTYFYLLLLHFCAVVQTCGLKIGHYNIIGRANYKFYKCKNKMKK